MNFEKRLKYNKYMNMDNVITIDLCNGYTVVAIIRNDSIDNYTVRLMLKNNSIDTWVLIENAENISFNATRNSIYSAILKTVSTYLNEGFFEYYIDRYNYEIKCFEIGNDLVEKNELYGGECYE